MPFKAIAQPTPLRQHFGTTRPDHFSKAYYDPAGDHYEIWQDIADRPSAFLPRDTMLARYMLLSRTRVSVLLSTRLPVRLLQAGIVATKRRQLVLGMRDSFHISHTVL